SSVEALALQPDGKIVAAGVSESDFALARYNPNGSLDTTFGTGGTLTTDFGSDSDQLRSVLLTADGRIVAVGSTGGRTTHLAPARYTANGTLDAGFGTGGKVTTDFIGPLEDKAQAVAVQPDGKLIVVGTSTVGSGSELAMVRYLANGVLDSAFGTGGRVTAAEFN